MPPLKEVELLEHPNADEVSQGEWLTGESPDKLFTTGLGPCAGVLVHNPKERRAALGHFVEPRMKVEGFADFVKKARQSLGEVVDQVVYMAGVAPEDQSKEAQEESAKVREHVVTAFLKSGYAESQLRQEWNQPDQYAILGVDTESGVHVLSHVNYGAEMRELDAE